MDLNIYSMYMYIYGRYIFTLICLHLVACSFNVQPSSAWFDILLLIFCDVLAYHQ